MRLVVIASAAILAVPPLVVAGGVGVVLLAVSQPEAAAASPHARADIPDRLLGVYQAAVDQRCPELSWTVLAAVGKVESDHARSGGAQLQPDGVARPWIIGPALDGSAGVQAIPDTDDGRWDRDSVWDRAVGPMQFLPATWRTYGVDASGAGEADPHNAIDAIHTAAVYLCEHGAGEPDGVRDALFAYNNADWYVDDVVDLAHAYGEASGAGPGGQAGGGEYALPVDRAWLSPEAMAAPHHSYPAWDLPLPVGTPVHAVHGGTVISTPAHNSKCGLGAVISGDDGARYTYCHATAVHAAVGDTIQAGHHLMDSGNTGRSTGPHLHLDIRWHGELVCPQPLLQAWHDGEPATPADAPTSGCSY